MRHFFSGTLLLIPLFYLPSHAINEAVESLVMFETRANAVATRSHKPVAMPHFEIPLDMLELDFAERFNPELRKHLIFEKKGKKFVRWVLNPEDTKWHRELDAHFLETKGLVLEKKYYFTGYQTASRSYIVEDPGKTVSFSIKSSTDTTGGHWADKPQRVDDATESRKNADFLHEVQKHLKFEYIVVMDEPAIIKAVGPDQALVIRDLMDLPQSRSGKLYLPGFSALHEKMGSEIARLNGSKDPYAFWTKHYIQATGRAMGELAARTGMQFDSPHSQNFLIELTTDFKPTGRIVIRDMADFYLNRDFMMQMAPDHLKGYYEGNILSNIRAGFGPLHGNQSPSWVPDAKYTAWLDVFYKEFDRMFFKTSGLKKSAVTASQQQQNLRYFGRNYTVDKEGSNAVKKFWSNLKTYKSPKGILNCSYVFMVK